MFKSIKQFLIQEDIQQEYITSLANYTSFVVPGQITPWEYPSMPKYVKLTQIFYPVDLIPDEVSRIIIYYLWEYEASHPFKCKYCVVESI